MLYIGPQGPCFRRASISSVDIPCHPAQHTLKLDVLHFRRTTLELGKPNSPFFSRNLVKLYQWAWAFMFCHYVYVTIIFINASLRAQTNGILGLQNLKENFNPLYPHLRFQIGTFDGTVTLNGCDLITTDAKLITSWTKILLVRKWVIQTVNIRCCLLPQ